MNRILTTSFALAAGALLLAGPAQAQDISATPTYGTQNLEAGFLPDPVSIDIAAGGGTEASVSGNGACAGFHATAPDVDLNYTAGGATLYVHVTSDADTTLLINAPDGSWFCNDDTNGLNPVVVFDPAQSGQYNIYVGTYDSGSTPPAQLHITEIDPR